MTRMPRMKMWLLFAFLFSLLFGREAQANTINAASCNTSDVQTAINAASDGDTVIIPNGSCTWSSGITTTKQIAIKGTSAGCMVPGNCGLTITHTAGASNLLKMTTGSSFHIEIANISFLPGTGTGDYIDIDGTGLVALMHDISFSIPNFQLSHAVNWLATGGVIWRANFYSTNNLAGACGGAVIGSDSGSLVIKSHKNWDDASTMGTLDINGVNNLYIEDSQFTYVGQAPDMDDNARVVIRHTTFTNTSGALTHGPTSTFGGRHVEIYDSTFSYTNPNKDLQRWFWGRGGTVVITGNTVDADTGGCHGSRSSWVFIVESATRSTSHGCCTGYACFHQPGTGSDGTSGHTFQHVSQTPPDTFAQSDPVYIWGNLGTGASNFGTNDGDLSCNTGNTTATFFHSGQDYFLNAGAKPGWTRFPYPHPLTLSTGTPPPSPPTKLAAVVQ